MKTIFRSAAMSLAGFGAAWWLLERATRLREVIELRPQWRNDDGCRSSSTEYGIDDTIEASFPASDPPSSTPIIGAGWRSH